MKRNKQGRMLCLSEMAQARTFEERLRILNGERDFTLEERRNALPLLAETARMWGQWLEIYYRTGEGSDMENRALAQLEKLHATAGQLDEALEFAPQGTRLRDIITARLTATGVDVNGNRKPFSVDNVLRKRFLKHLQQ